MQSIVIHIGGTPHEARVGFEVAAYLLARGADAAANPGRTAVELLYIACPDAADWWHTAETADAAGVLDLLRASDAIAEAAVAGLPSPVVAHGAASVDAGAPEALVDIQGANDAPAGVAIGSPEWRAFNDVREVR